MKKGLVSLLHEVNNEINIFGNKYIEQYVEKIVKNAEIVCIYNQGEVSGFIAIYINITEKSSFITMICIRKEARNSGYGKILIDSAIKIAKNSQVNKVSLEVNSENSNALGFYQKLGFEITETNGRSILMSKKL